MQLPDNNVMELAKFYTWMGSDGIARTKVKPNAEIFIQDAKENTALIETFYNNKKLPLIVDMRDIKSVSSEAREHFTLNGRDSVVAAFAMLTSSSLSRMIGNFFLSFHKPKVPVKLFIREDKAIEWLKPFAL